MSYEEYIAYHKGTRWDGYYTERMLSDADGTPYRDLIYSLANETLRTYHRH